MPVEQIAARGTVLTMAAADRSRAQGDRGRGVGLIIFPPGDDVLSSSVFVFFCGVTCQRRKALNFDAPGYLAEKADLSLGIAVLYPRGIVWDRSLKTVLYGVHITVSKHGSSLALFAFDETTLYSSVHGV